HGVTNPIGIHLRPERPPRGRSRGESLLRLRRPRLHAGLPVLGAHHRHVLFRLTMKKLLLFLLLLACDDPALVLVDDGYPDATRVDAVWWRETLVPDAVEPGASSPAYRATTGADYAYFLLERNGVVFVARSKDVLSVA